MSTVGALGEACTTRRRVFATAPTPPAPPSPSLPPPTLLLPEVPATEFVPAVFDFPAEPELPDVPFLPPTLDVPAVPAVPVLSSSSSLLQAAGAIATIKLRPAKLKNLVFDLFIMGSPPRVT